MGKGYLHVEIAALQASMKPGAPCGDVVDYERDISSTTLVVSDGIGHGIKAEIAARMCVARLLELLRQGYSLRKAFSNLVKTMEQAKGTDMPYAVFTVVRILNDGVATVLSYEMPAPIFVTSRYSQVLPQRKVAMESILIGEANCHVEPGEGIIVVSDGITQAGLGQGLAKGWTIDGVSQHMTHCLTSGTHIEDVPARVLQEAHRIGRKSYGDDCTAALASCRRGRTVSILTGPPGNPDDDRDVIKRFMLSEGTKVVCGGTTARIVSDYLGNPMQMEEDAQSLLAPPMYIIEGIDLVTEGAVTLNQVYNVLDEDPSRHDEESGVTELHEMLRSADRVNIMVGGALNPATGDISFRQKGILTRHAIVPILVDKLRAAGKLVVVEKI